MIRYKRERFQRRLQVGSREVSGRGSFQMQLREGRFRKFPDKATVQSN